MALNCVLLRQKMGQIIKRIFPVLLLRYCSADLLKMFFNYLTTLCVPALTRSRSAYSLRVRCNGPFLSSGHTDTTNAAPQTQGSLRWRWKCKVFTSQQAAVWTCWSPNSPPQRRPPHRSPCNHFTGTLIFLLLRKPHPFSLSLCLHSWNVHGGGRSMCVCVCYCVSVFMRGLELMPEMWMCVGVFVNLTLSSILVVLVSFGIFSFFFPRARWIIQAYSGGERGENVHGKKNNESCAPWLPPCIVLQGVQSLYSLSNPSRAAAHRCTNQPSSAVCSPDWRFNCCICILQFWHTDRISC